MLNTDFSQQKNKRIGFTFYSHYWTRDVFSICYYSTPNDNTDCYDVFGCNDI